MRDAVFTIEPQSTSRRNKDKQVPSPIVKNNGNQRYSLERKINCNSLEEIKPHVCAYTLDGIRNRRVELGREFLVSAVVGVFAIGGILGDVEGGEVIYDDDRRLAGGFSGGPTRHRFVKGDDDVGAAVLFGVNRYELGDLVDGLAT